MKPLEKKSNSTDRGDQRASGKELSSKRVKKPLGTSAGRARRGMPVEPRSDQPLEALFPGATDVHPKLHYDRLIETIHTISSRLAARVVSAADISLVLRNWSVGAWLIEYEQNGSDRSRYGEKLLSTVANDLKRRGIRGLGVTSLRYCRMAYRTYPQIHQQVVDVFAGGQPSMTGSAIHQQVVDGSCNTLQNEKIGKKSNVPDPISPDILLRLSWTHLTELVSIEDPWKRAFYENLCISERWSVPQLRRQLDSMLYERTGLSTDKKQVIANARSHFEATSLQFADVIRDPYVLEFLGLAEKTSYLESDLEQAMLDHLQAFLLELGAGFCFEARQYRIKAGTDDDRVDLVFYHRHLKCHVLIELKTRRFRPADAGQMNYYLNYFRSQVMDDGDLAPVGIILCCDKEQTKVEYATAGLDNNVFVSRYLVALPSPEQLQNFIEEDRSRIEAMRSSVQTDKKK